MNKILGIDVGGTKIAAGLVGKQGRILDLRLFPTSKNKLVGQLQDIIGLYQGYDAIGIGMPGQVLDSGEVVHLGNVKHFATTNLKKLIARRFKANVVIENDANCFAYAEAMAGLGQRFYIVAGVTLGTGIGGGIVINKKIYRGAEGLAGEFGQIPMLDGITIERHIQKAGLFSHGREARKYLKVIIGSVVRSINPEIIVIGGAWSQLPGVEQISKIVLKEIKYTSKTIIKVSRMKHAGVLGAALLALKK